MYKATYDRQSSKTNWHQNFHVSSWLDNLSINVMKALAVFDIIGSIIVKMSASVVRTSLKSVNAA